MRGELANEKEIDKLNWIFVIPSNSDKRGDLPDLSISLEFGEKPPRLVASGKQISSSKIQKSSGIYTTTKDNEGYTDEQKYIWRINLNS